MTAPTPLSPAAQAVLDAFFGSTPAPGRHELAAALRAAADQVASNWDAPGWDNELVMGQWQESSRIRSELLTIADELQEGAQ